MGMFDYIKCDMLTVDGTEITPGLYQTKSTDCNMAQLHITKEGRLVMVDCGFTGGEPDKDKGDTSIDLNFHGDIQFYDYRDGEMIEYMARFYNGQCNEVIPWDKWKAMGVEPRWAEATTYRI